MTTAACFVDENGQFIADRKNPTVRAAGRQERPCCRVAGGPHATLRRAHNPSSVASLATPIP